jgi:uncharacterized damage-inducible protein DinB
MRTLCTAVLALAVAAPAAAQSGAMATALKAHYEIVKSDITRTAEKVPEDLYSFKPAPEVRTLGEILGHLADANTMICSMASGATPPAGKVEKNKTAKADLQKALADAFAVCDAAFASMTEAKGGELVKFYGGEQPRLAVLSFNTAHDFEHYGNLVTYMRAKGIVPPSSEPRQGSQ